MNEKTVRTMIASNRIGAMMTRVCLTMITVMIQIHAIGSKRHQQSHYTDSSTLTSLGQNTTGTTTRAVTMHLPVQIINQTGNCRSKNQNQYAGAQFQNNCVVTLFLSYKNRAKMKNHPGNYPGQNQRMNHRKHRPTPPRLAAKG